MKQRLYNYRQVYEALIRAKFLAGLSIVGKFQREFVQANPEVIQEYERLRSDSFALISNNSLPRKSFTTLWNIRSIFKHISDFFEDDRLYNTPMICFTKTQITQNMQILFQ